jgi:hypothetical protein
MRMMTSRNMRWTGRVAHTQVWGGEGIHKGFWWKSQKERDHYEDLYIDEMTIL